MTGAPSFRIRVWLPDRPGALGQVASRVGAVRGEIVGIDILERGAGQAIDELVVQLPDASLRDLVVAEIGQVDGVSVENVRQCRPGEDPSIEGLECAAALVTCPPDRLPDVAVAQVLTIMRGTWSALVDTGSPELAAVAGEPPAPAWLTAYVSGSRASHAVVSGDAGPDDVMAAGVDGTDLILAVGRDGTPFRSRERRQLAAVATIVGSLLRSERGPHPVTAGAGESTGQDRG